MSYVLEWIPGVGFLGAVLLFLIVPPFALIGLAVVALAALAALVALAGAVLAAPFLLVRSLRRRRSPAGAGPLARVIAQAGSATPQSGVAALAQGADRIEVTSGHCATISHPEETHERIVTAANAVAVPE
jgi:hypothetical protein